MTHSGARHGNGTPRRPAAEPSLLGTYPVPALHLVGAPVRLSPQSPSGWQPTPSPLQYGLDYTFLRGRPGDPVTWRHGLPVTVRITGAHTPGQAAAAAAVTAELAALSGIALIPGDPRSMRLDPETVPGQEIHVAFRPTADLGPPATCRAGSAGFGGAVPAPDGRYYLSGFAVVTADPHGSDEPELAALRHELAHALGLGHAARPSLLMHPRIPATTGGYGRGDRHGLALLGWPVPATSQPHRRPWKAPICTA